MRDVIKRSNFTAEVRKVAEWEVGLAWIPVHVFSRKGIVIAPALFVHHLDTTLLLCPQPGRGIHSWDALIASRKFSSLIRCPECSDAGIEI